MTTTWLDGNVITNTFMNQAQRRIEAVAHVEDPAYGAVGDGTTDDTAAIQAAFAAAETVIFRAGATYKVTSTLFLSKAGSTINVKRIKGNGATINFVISGTTTANLSTMYAGLAACPKDTSVNGEYSGWNGHVDDLNFTSSSDIVLTYLMGTGAEFTNCRWTASGNCHGGVVVVGCINLFFTHCYFLGQDICTDTTGTGSFSTDANGDNIPSSFGILQYPRWPGQTLGGVSYISATTNYFTDNLGIKNCVFAGFFCQFFFGGSQSHGVYSVENCEFAYNHYGAIVSNLGMFANNWFENTKVTCLKIVGVSPPWHLGTGTLGTVIESCSFSPHNAGGGSTCIDLLSVAYGTVIRNCMFADAATRVYSTCGTDAHIYLIGGNTIGVFGDNFTGAVLKITKIGWQEGNTVEFPDDVSITRVGKGLKIKEGSNARMGTSTLVAGTVVVANTSVTASTRVFCSRMATGGTVGHLSVVLNAGVGFTINSSSAADTSTVAWMLLEPA